MADLPRDPAFDCTLRLIGDPYRYISRRSRELGSDVFQTRLMLEPAVCGGGADFAKLLYDNRLFTRAGAMPRRVRRTLTGMGGVQGLDGAAHANRKAMFMSALTGAPAARLADLAREDLQAHAEHWARSNEIVFYAEMKVSLTRSVCRFAGVPLSPKDAPACARDLALMFEGAGQVGPVHWRARRARKRAERWIGAFVQAVRNGDIQGAQGSAADAIARHRDENGQLLPVPTAAVEILNVLRPVVAIAVYAAFTAHALKFHRDAVDRIASGDDAFTRSFIQEVRRFYPFFPVVAARAATRFDLGGTSIPQGRLFILDLFGTCHHERLFDAPQVFDPERFMSEPADPFELIPQGGGDHFAGHRCAGEEITLAVMSMIARFLTRRISYELPEQNMEIDWSRPPAVPRDGLRMRIHAH